MDNSSQDMLFSRHRPLQAAIDRGHDELPAMLMEGMVRDKLKDAGIKIRKTALKRLVGEILNGDLDAIDIHDDDLKAVKAADPKFVLSFDDSDIEELERRFQRFLKQLPNMINKLARKSGKDFVKFSKQQWVEDYGLRLTENAAFTERVRYRWRKGLTPLNLLLETSRVYGESRWKEDHDDANGTLTPRLDVLYGLHIRGCQVGAEIITLLEAGFADGAMARWRTLFEIGIVATLIHNSDDTTAQKYLDHSLVDAKKAADRYMMTSAHARSDPVSDEEMAALNIQVEALKARYGEDFKHPYGWAAELTGNPRPNFSTLVEFAEQDSIQSIYKMASYNIHANARSLFFRHTDMQTNSGVISGASNAGLEDPGTHTAYTIGQLTVLLMPQPITAMDDLVILNAIIRLRHAAEKGFYKAAEKLKHEDADQAALIERPSRNDNKSSSMTDPADI